jgi:hypothetical protein
VVAAHPLDGVVVAVPEDDEHAAGPQHAGDLGLGERPVEPVPRRADDDGVHRGVRQRDPLGGALVGVDGGEVGAELGEHRGIGIHRRDAHAGPPRSSASVTLPVPAPRSSTSPPGAGANAHSSAAAG